MAVLSNLLGGAVIGLVALAMDYFFFQHSFKTPISMGGGFNIAALLIYLIVPFLLLTTSGAKKA